MIRLVLSELDFDYELQALVCSFFSGFKCHVEILEGMHEIITQEEDFAESVIKKCGFDDGGDSLLVAVYLGGERICAAVTAGGYSLCRNEKDLDGNRDWHKLEGKKKHPYRTEYKNKLKRLVFNILKDFPEKHLPEGAVRTVPVWGTMTGVRPTKIIMSELLKGEKPEDMRRTLDAEYCCSKDKAELGMKIAEKEKHVLETVDYENEYSLYVGIPFCPSTCMYCSFTSYPMDRYGNFADDYLRALASEIKAASEVYPDRNITSIYIGGGTPTALTAEQLDGLLFNICRYFNVLGCREFTVEAGRPDSITKEKLTVLAKYGVDRISINPQTMQLKTLEFIGRKHTPKQVVESFLMAREMGFSNINMDLIIGLPGEDIHDFENTLGQIEKLRPESLTVHSLVVKRGSKLRELLEEQDGCHTAAGMDYKKGMEKTAEAGRLKRHGHVKCFVWLKSLQTVTVMSLIICTDRKMQQGILAVMDRKILVFRFHTGRACITFLLWRRCRPYLPAGQVRQRRFMTMG